MTKIVNKAGIVTIVMVLAFLIAAIGGVVVVIIQPTTLSFNDYLKDLGEFAGALGLLGVGRGLHLGLSAQADSATLQAKQDPGDPPNTSLKPLKTTVTIDGKGLGEWVEQYQESAISSEGPDESADHGAGPGDEDAFPHIPVTEDYNWEDDQGESISLADQAQWTTVAQAAASRSGSYSGLNASHRKTLIAAMVHAVNLCFAHSSELAYTEGPERWSGMTPKLLRASKGEYPKKSDCSAWYAWVFRQGAVLFHLHDRVNGLHWLAGWTGSMLMFGKTVHHRENWQVGDAIIYDGHVAWYMGGGFVASHGSAGVHKLPWDYRPDFVACKRYV